MRTILFPISLAGLLACALAAQSLSPLPRPVRYNVTDLGPVGGPPGQPIIIKNNYLIAGSHAVSDNVWHSLLWYQGLKYDIGMPGLGGPSSEAFGLNEKDQAVGQAETPAMDPNGEDFCGFGSHHVCRAFVWQNGLMTALPPLMDSNGGAGANGVANAINNRGQVGGSAETTERDPSCPPLDPTLYQYQQFKFKPVIWDSGKVQELPTVAGDPDGIVFSMNEQGQAVGGTGTCNAYQINGNLTYLYGLHATLWENGKVTDMGNLGGIGPGGGNVAVIINNRGQSVGSSGTPDGSFHAFIWSKDTGMRDIGTVGGDVASVALSINDNGDAVGISFDKDFNPRAFVRQDGGSPVDLNALIPASSPLFLFDACSINSSGEIIGIALDSKGTAHGYLATPQFGGTSFVTPPDATQFEYARKLLRRK